MVKWIAGGLVALVLAVAAGWWGVGYYGQRRAERQFDTVIKPILPSGAEHGAIRYAIAGDRLEVDDIVAKNEATGLKSIRIAHTTVAGASAPRLDGVRLEKVVVEGAAGDHVEIEEVTAGGVDLAALKSITDGVAAGTAAPIESLSIVGLKSHSGQFDSMVEKLSFSGLRTPLPAKGVGPDELRAWFTKLELDKAEIGGVDFRATGADSGHAGIRRLAISDVAPGKLGGIALEGLTVDAKDGAGLKLASVELAGLAYRPRSEAAKAAAALLGVPGANWLPGRVFFDRFAVGEVSIAAPGGGDLSLKEIRSAMAGTIAQATGFDFQVSELSLDLTKLPATPLGDPAVLGLDRLVLDIDAKSTYDPATKVVEIPRYAFVLRKLGSLTLSARLGNLAADESADDPLVAMQRILAAELRRFEIRYDDDSLALRLMEIAAKQRGSDVETVRSGLINQVELQKETLSGKPELAAMLDVVIAFLKDPHSLTIAVEPPKPLPISTLGTLSKMDPNDVPALLGLTIK